MIAIALFQLSLLVLCAVGFQGPRSRPRIFAFPRVTQQSKIQRLLLRMAEGNSDSVLSQAEDDSVLSQAEGEGDPVLSEGDGDSLLAEGDGDSVLAEGDEESFLFQDDADFETFAQLYNLPTGELDGEEWPFDKPWSAPELGFDEGVFETRLTTNMRCPYAQKLHIALELCKTWGLIYREVDLYGPDGKPEWFMEFNPNGTVPVCEFYGGAIICIDSERSLDLIKDGYVYEGPMFAPDTDAEQDAEDEWRFFSNTTLPPVGKAAVLGGEAEKGKLIQLLDDMDEKVRGKFLAADKITTADCSAFPFLWRLEQEFACLPPNLKNWLDEMLGQEQVFETVKSTQNDWWWWW